MNFLRTSNRGLSYIYSAIKSAHHISAASDAYCARFKCKERGLLSIVNAEKYISTTKMSTANPVKTINYENVKALKDNQKVLLVDVREPLELKETGVLPGSINIPLGEVEKVLKNMSPDEFAKRFGRPKPDFNFPVVFSCRSGKRSEMAATTAIKLGFKDVSNYTGGWLDWEEKSKH